MTRRIIQSVIIGLAIGVGVQDWIAAVLASVAWFLTLAAE